MIGLKNSSAVFTPERDKGGTEEEEEEDIQNTRMGVGKNNTSKSLDSSSEGGKYEEESKHDADFYPIPVHNYALMAFITVVKFWYTMNMPKTSSHNVKDWFDQEACDVILYCHFPSPHPFLSLLLTPI